MIEAIKKLKLWKFLSSKYFWIMIFILVDLSVFTFTESNITINKIRMSI